MQAAVEFKGETRNASGKGAARAARREGKVPVVLYANNKTPVHANIDANQLTQAYIKGGFMNKIISLAVDGKTYFGVPREIQTHPVSDKIEHADFLQVDAKSEVKVFVPVHISGAEKSLGMKRGGVLNVVAHQVPLLCNVTKIPASVDIDVTNLNINSSIHLSDVALPEGVKPANKRVDITIVSISGRAADEEPAAAAASAEVPASTAKAPAAAAAAKK
ncbi:MAG: 50S ribosomal protein L25 [Alphaproteobacteria bacterium]|nr:50S ribosomal protein L25 [Alphaproteobacteria bacterium]